LYFGGFGVLSVEPPVNIQRGERGNRTLAVVSLPEHCVSTSPSPHRATGGIRTHDSGFPVLRLRPLGNGGNHTAIGQSHFSRAGVVLSSL
jgi:hypothetical protein